VLAPAKCKGGDPGENESGEKPRDCMKGKDRVPCKKLRDLLSGGKGMSQCAVDTVNFQRLIVIRKISEKERKECSVEKSLRC